MKNVVSYRLLTTGSVEIEIMKKQISKKKLERLTIEGGDYRKAGQRSNSSRALSIEDLEELLEDDVRNLARREQSSGGGSSSSGSGGGREVHGVNLSKDISEDELGLILDREKLFREEKLMRDRRAASVSAAVSASAVEAVEFDENERQAIANILPSDEVNVVEEGGCDVLSVDSQPAVVTVSDDQEEEQREGDSSSSTVYP